MENDEREKSLDEAASLYEGAARELEQAAAHARVAAEHFRGGEVPRGGAHAWAARGHLVAAEQALDQPAGTRPPPPREAGYVIRGCGLTT